MKNGIRRYNFIVGTHCLYSGLFEKSGLFDFALNKMIKRKIKIISMNYGVPEKMINVSNTLKRS